MKQCRPPLIFAWLSAALMLGGAPSSAVESPQPGAPLKYRKIFVPADQVEKWPQGSARYVPVAAAEFQRLVDAAAQRSGDAEVPAAGYLTSARYVARLTSDGLLEGDLQWQVRYDGSESVLVPLAPCGIAMRDPVFSGDKKGQAAALGVDRDGVLRLVVSKGGTLEAEWSLQAQRQPGGAWSSTLSLPAIPSSHLQLDLPDHLEPWIASHAVSQVAGGPPGMRRWHIQLAGRPKEELRFAPAEKSSAESPRDCLRQGTVYEFSPRGIEVSTRLSLAVGARPMGQLRLQLSSGMHLLDAKMGDSSLSWTRHMAVGQGADQVVLELPEPLADTQRVVQLRALAPLTTGKRLVLPTLRPQNVFWQEGTATLLVPQPLVLSQLQVKGCRQTKVLPLAGAEGEMFVLQCFVPDAHIEARVDQSVPSLHVASATAVSLNPRAIQARFVADCTVTQSERFTFQSVVLPGWQVEQVESDPSGGIERWSVVSQDGKPRLLVQLAQAISPKRPLRLVVEGRLGRSALTAPVAHGVLRMLEPEQVVWTERLTGLSASQPHRLQISGDEDVVRLDPRSLATASQKRFKDAAADVVYRDDAGADRLQAALVRQPAGHTADIAVALHVGGDTLEESIRVICRPDSSGLSRLLVHASQARPEKMAWSIKGEPAVQVSARHLTQAQQREAGFAHGETWEVELDRTRTAEFELQARRDQPFAGVIEAALFSVAPMLEQRAKIAISCAAGEAVQIDNQRLSPIPTEIVAVDKVNALRGSYRYDPERDVLAQQSMLTLARPKTDALTPGAVAWTAQYEARWQTDGTVQHQATLHIENQGRRQIRVDLPSGATLQQVAVDGVFRRRLGDDRPQAVLVELDAHRRFSTVQLNYESHGAPWNSWQWLSPRLPLADIPILNVRGKIAAPPGYRVLWSSQTGRLPISDGWTSVPLNLNGRAVPNVFIVREPIWMAAGWSLFLLAAVGLWWRYPRRLRPWMLLFCALGILALLLPAAGAAVAMTLLLAALAAAAAIWIVPPGARWLTVAEQPSRTTQRAAFRDPLPSTLSQPQPSGGSSVRRILPLWLLVMLLAGPRPASQADDPKPGSRQREVVHSVLVPIGKDRKPSGDTWYVPIELYRALSARAAAQSVDRHGWLITDVDYRGRLDFNAARTRLQLAELKADYEVETFGRQTLVSFPLSREAVALAAGATVDGSAVEPVWDQQGKSLLVDVSQRGRHRIVLPLTPVAQDADVPVVEMDTPPLPTAELELDMPSSAPPVRVTTALGAVQLDEESNRMTARLGGGSKLALSWTQPSPSGTASDADVQQLLWLKIAPGAVTVEARMKLHGLEGRLNRFDVLLDPRLRLLGAASSAGGPIETRIVPGASQTVVLESPRGFSADEEIRLSLLWTDASGLGRVPLPKVAPAAARTWDGWLAVSVDQSLKHQTPDQSELTAETQAELLSRWPLGHSALDLVYRLPRDDARWYIATEPRQVQTTSEETLALSLSSDSAEALYAAGVATSGSQFQYQLRVPPGCTVSRVALTPEGESESRVARWSQTDTLVTILLKQPVTGRQRLSVRGRWPLTGTKLALPDFHLEDCQRESFDLAVYRRPGIDVQPTDTEAIHELTEPTTEMLLLTERLPRWFGRLVGQYRVVNPQAASIFSFRPVPQRTEATQVLTFSRQEKVWQASVDFRLKVLSAAVDAIRFQLPPAVRGPFEITPPQPYSVVEMPDQRQRQLVIRLREPVRDQLRLTITSPVSPTAGERVAAPGIAPLDVAKLEQFVVLPKQVDQERVEWELRGLERQPLPADGEAAQVAPEEAVTYRVVGGQFQAELASVARTERAPRVRLVDVRVNLSATGPSYGLATFDLEPNGLQKCVIRTPSGVMPLGAAIGALPTTLVPLETGAWQISLVSTQLPQRIKLLFQSPSAESKTTLATPTIGGAEGPFEVAQTLWTVHGPRDLAIQATRAETSAFGLQWLRAESIGATLADANTDQSADVLARWYEPWASELCDAWRQLKLLAPSAGPGGEAAATRLRDHQRQQQDIAQRLRTFDVLDEAMHAKTPGLENKSWQLALSNNGAQSPVYVSATGALPTLDIESRAILSNDSIIRWTLAGLLAGLAGVIGWTNFGRRLRNGPPDVPLLGGRS